MFDPLTLVPSALKVWELLQRPRLAIHSDWIDNPPHPILRFHFVNKGRKLDSITEIRFGTADTPDGEGWLRLSIMNQLPVAIAPGHASPPFNLVTDPAAVEGFPEFQQHLRAGAITKCTVQTALAKHPKVVSAAASTVSGSAPGLAARSWLRSGVGESALAPNGSVGSVR